MAGLSPLRPFWRPALLGAAVWLAAALLLGALDAWVDLAYLSHLLVLAAAASALCWPFAAVALASTLAVVAFNVAFVPPRGSLSVSLPAHGLLLAHMLAVSWIVAALIGRRRYLAAQAREAAQRADELRGLADVLRATDDPARMTGPLRDALQRLSGGGAAAVLLHAPDGPALHGDVDEDGRVALELCARQGEVLGAGTARHTTPGRTWLPLRGRSGALGAVELRWGTRATPEAAQLAHGQALCDVLAAALDRREALRQADDARAQAQIESLRHTLLSAVAHDHRTPLATIISAAGALEAQDARLQAPQRQKIARTILQEATHLARLTENILQLARLQAGIRDLPPGWESIEEIVGSAVQRQQQRSRSPGGASALRLHLEPGLPLVRCDPVLLAQLVDNLVDNALRHGGPAGPVEISAASRAGWLHLAVADRGPGIPPEWRERVFERFVRRTDDAGAPGGAPAARGTGVGLALCRAIAEVHGARLGCRSRPGGGTVFELAIPVTPAPADPPPAPPRELAP